MTIKIFERIGRTFERAAPSLLSLDWSQYGTKLKPYSSDGKLPKWTGFIIHNTSTPITGSNTKAFGLVIRPEESAQVLLTKVRALHDRSDVRSSMQVRDPERAIYGGAVRTSIDPSIMLVLGGLPEILDHLSVAQALLTAGLLTTEDWAALTNDKQVFLTEPMKEVGMSVEHFRKLRDAVIPLIIGPEWFNAA